MTGDRRWIGLAASGLLLIGAIWYWKHSKEQLPPPQNPLVAEVAVLEQKKDAAGLRQFISTNSNAGAVAFAVHSLANVEGKAALPTVVTALADSRPEVRIAAASAMEIVAEPAEPGPLMNVLQADSEPEVRAAAAKALGGLKAYDSADALVAALSDKNTYVRECAIAAIHRMLTIRFPYKATDEPAKRQVAIAQIRKVMPVLRDKLKAAHAAKK